jgi:transposase InsO family protein
MRESNLQGKYRRKFKVVSNIKHKCSVYPNLLNQDFRASAPNKVWVSDISFIWTQEGWVYLAIVLDLYSRAIVGWALADHISQSLITQAFLKAYCTRQPKPGLIYHSDRDSQYTVNNFQAILRQLGVISNMSNKGNCYDNAVAESFFHTIKNELIFNRTFKTKQEVKSAIFEYIELFYNKERIHSYLN